MRQMLVRLCAAQRADQSVATDPTFEEVCGTSFAPGAELSTRIALDTELFARRQDCVPQFMNEAVNGASGEELQEAERSNDIFAGNGGQGV